MTNVTTASEKTKLNLKHGEFVTNGTAIGVVNHVKTYEDRKGRTRVLTVHVEWV